MLNIKNYLYRLIKKSLIKVGCAHDFDRVKLKAIFLFLGRSTFLGYKVRYTIPH